MLSDKLKHTFVRDWYYAAKRQQARMRCVGKFKLEDRRHHSDTMVIILSGYKAQVWDVLYDRINRFAPKDADVCIVSSGLYSERLSEIAKQYGWSYLSTKKNKLTLALNIAIRQFEDAQYIFKLDEDIFVTEHFFTDLKAKLLEAESAESLYDPCFVAPLIPINGFPSDIERAFAYDSPTSNEPIRPGP